MEGSRRTAPKNVLITRLSAIGDCILTIPLAVRVKELWPDCKLSWIVDCAASQLLEEHSAIDDLIKIQRGWLKCPSDWKRLREDLQSREFDLTLDPQGLTKSSLLGWMSGARRRIGFDFSHGRELAPLVATQRVRRTARHMVDTYLELLTPWTSISPGQGQFKMPVYEQAAIEAKQVLAQQGLRDEAWIALNPGAGWTTKLWPVQRFGMLAREIYREHGRRSLVFWAGEAELLMAKVIEEESRGAAVLAPRTSLTEMLEMLRLASLLVTGDTGPLHMASSVGTPCVALHGPTWSDETGPYGNRHIAIQSPIRALSKKQIRKGQNIAMQAVEVDEVYHACARLFHQERSERLVA